MGVNLTFQIEGQKELSAELGLIADHIKDWEPPLKKAGDILLKSFGLNFNSRGQLFQGGWPKRKVDKPWPLLEKSGEMRHGFDAAVTGDFVELGNTAKHFKYHQSNKPRSRLPRRIMMKIDEPRRREIVKTFQAYILSQGGSQRL